MKPGDVFFIKSIGHLDKNYSEILEQWRYLNCEKGISIVVLNMLLQDTLKGKILPESLFRTSFCSFCLMWFRWNENALSNVKPKTLLQQRFGVSNLVGSISRARQNMNWGIEVHRQRTSYPTGSFSAENQSSDYF